MMAIQVQRSPGVSYSPDVEAESRCKYRECLPNLHAFPLNFPSR